VLNRKASQYRRENHKDAQCSEGNIARGTRGQFGPRRPRAIDIQALFLNEFEIADVLGISVATVRRWRLKRRGPTFVKVAGTLIRYPVEALEEWLAAQPSGGEPLGSPSSQTIGATAGGAK